MTEQFTLQNPPVVVGKGSKNAQKKAEEALRVIPAHFNVGERSPQAFEVEPHLCRGCFGRVISMAAPGERYRIYRCSNCGLRASGTKPNVICACGLTILKDEKNAGIRCVVNPDTTPENPSEIIAKETR